MAGVEGKTKKGDCGIAVVRLPHTIRSIVGERKFIYSSLAFLVCLLAYQAAPVLRRALDSAEVRPGGQFHLVPILCFHNIDGAGPSSVSQERFR